MSNRKWLMTGGLVTAGILLARGASWTQKLEMLQYSFANFSIRFSGLTPVLSFRLNIYNPNRENVSIRDISGAIKFQGNTISNFNSTNTTDFVVEGKKAVAVEIRANLSLGPVVQAIISKVPGMKVDIDGVMSTPMANIPFTKTFEPSQV